MADETLKYKDQVSNLLIAKEIDFKVKPMAKSIQITTKNIVINGKEGRDPSNIVKPNFPIDCDWQLTVPLGSITSIYLYSFKAESLMHFHKDAVGIEAKIDGVVMNYAIFTKHPEDLSKMIEDLTEYLDKQ